MEWYIVNCSVKKGEERKTETIEYYLFKSTNAHYQTAHLFTRLFP